MSAEWSARCFHTTGAVRKVKARYVSRIRAAPTTIHIVDPPELLAVGARGRVIVPGIAHTGDFDMPNPDGIERFTAADRRCGYFARKTFAIVVPAQFDYCAPFADGKALACTDCAARCSDADCHDTTVSGGHGVELDVAGKVRRRYAIPYSTPLPDPSTSTGVR